ncbi:MAG TPA: diacylglycerol kinase family protein [Bryobacteraceae bacterium]|nr:diacylglycerol kinase family protein [Bryobacteraceae bacterium]
MSEIVVVLNPKSGPAYRRVGLEDLERRLAARDVTARVIQLRRHGEIRQAAEEAIRGGCRVVVAAGGDGTVSAVAAAVAGTASALGVLPIGTLNHFARDLGIPLDLDAAIEVLAKGHSECVDIAEVNGRSFVNNSSIGMYPRIVVLREREQRIGHNKWVALGLAVLTVLRRFPFWTVRVHVENQVKELRTPFVFVGNNEYELEGLELGHRGAINGGRLFLYVAAHTTRFRLVRMALGALLGRLDKKRSSLEMFNVTEAWIETRRKRVRVSTDGQVSWMWSPLHYRLRPLGLRVIVP